MAIKGAILPFEINKPLIAPKIAPVKRPIKTANGALIPFAIKPAVNALESAKVDPTDKSIPPVKITKVIPKAIKPFAATWRSKFNKLFGFKNSRFITETTITKTISANKGPSFVTIPAASKLLFFATFFLFSILFSSCGIGHNFFLVKIFLL